MSSSPHCIKCGDYIHHRKVVCEPCFFNVETAHQSAVDVQAHHLRALNAELVEALSKLHPIADGLLSNIPLGAGGWVETSLIIDQARALLEKVREQ